MIYPSADKLELWGSKYALVVLAAKRAKQLKSGAAPLIDTDSRNPLTVALEEIAAGVIECRVPDNDLIPTVSQEPEVAALLAFPTEEIEEEAEVAEVSLKDEATAVLGGDELEEEEETDEEELAVHALLGDEEDVDTEEDEGLPGFGDDDDEPELISDADEAAPEEEAISVPKKPGRKRKVKAEPEVIPIALDDDDDIEEPDEDSDE